MGLYYYHYVIILVNISHGVETASHVGHCPINQQDRSDENRSKCPVVGSMFPYPRFTAVGVCQESYDHFLAQ